VAVHPPCVTLSHFYYRTICRSHAYTWRGLCLIAGHQISSYHGLVHISRCGPPPDSRGQMRVLLLGRAPAIKWCSAIRWRRESIGFLRLNSFTALGCWVGYERSGIYSSGKHILAHLEIYVSAQPPTGLVGQMAGPITNWHIALIYTVSTCARFWLGFSAKANFVRIARLDKFPQSWSFLWHCTLLTFPIITTPPCTTQPFALTRYSSPYTCKILSSCKCKRYLLHRSRNIDICP
jgi:hypothetical protein